MSFLRKRWKFVFGVAISVVFLWFSLRGLHLQAVWYYIQVANFWWILPAVAVYFAAVWARTWRWHYLLRPLKPVPLGRFFPIVCIGYFGNNVYPARAGEVIRVRAAPQRGYQRQRLPGDDHRGAGVRRAGDVVVRLLRPAVRRVRAYPGDLSGDHRCGQRRILRRPGRVSLDGLGPAALQPDLSLLFRSAGAGAFPCAAGRLCRAFHVRVELPAQRPRCADGLRDLPGHLAAGDRQVLADHARVSRLSSASSA